jgi:type I restriction enzyme S subunit
VTPTATWSTHAFEELVDFHDHRRVPLSKKERSTRQGPYPYYGAQGVIDGVDDYLFDGKFLLIAEDGENLNSRKLPIAFFAEGQFWVNNHAHVVAARPGVADEDFLRVYVEFHPLNGHITGAAQPKLSQGSLKRLSVTAPPFDLQVRIGNAIRALDGLIENNRRRVEILEEMAGLVYREWFVHFRFPGHEDVDLVDSDLGPIPDGWEVAPVSSAIGINPRESVSKGDERPFVTMADLSERSMVCSPSELRKGNSGAKFRNGDTLFARITPCLENGKTGFVNWLADGQVGRGSTEFLVFRGEAVGPEFTYLLARTEDLRQHAIKSMSGASGRQRVRTECFDSYWLAVPPLDVQAEFAALVRPMFDLVKVLSQQTEVLREARDLLLPRLVSGELDVSELDLKFAEVG